MSYKLGDRESCPTCKGAWEASCRCRIGHLTCENGHVWVNCRTHGPAPAYQPPDGSHAYCGRCAQKPMAEGDTSYWEVADPLRRHDMLLSVGVDPYKTRRYRDCDWKELPFEIQTSLAGKLKLAEEGEMWDRTETRDRREMMVQARFPETEITPYLKTMWADLPQVMRDKLSPLFRNRNRTQQESTTCRLLGKLFDL